MWYVYIVECSDNSLYTGTTINVIERIKKHNSKRGAKYTRSRLPVKLLMAVETIDRSTACKLESKIKKLSRQDKLKLIRINESWEH